MCTTITPTFSHHYHIAKIWNASWCIYKILTTFIPPYIYPISSCISVTRLSLRNSPSSICSVLWIIILIPSLRYSIIIIARITSKCKRFIWNIKPWNPTDKVPNLIYFLSTIHTNLICFFANANGVMNTSFAFCLRLILLVLWLNEWHIDRLCFRSLISITCCSVTQSKSVSKNFNFLFF